jgi:hypothetical protein|nr:MAG TPA: hypothetical protein [Caudoviricetes sp.]DAP30498.1 MAG TPA: hypothetical protein [Caudoviricetes sp.]DAV35834.1 MAG TPA: hypothetical protein [Caudoviricetes sp.]DAV66009.1 MAG TPA: hypothetical protein [Caudoviricetes sp.]
MVRTAVDLHMRPTAVIYNQPDPFGHWTELDYKLVLAYKTVKDETCQKCGNPIWLCHSTDPDIAWRAEDRTCYATKARMMHDWVSTHRATDPPPYEDKQKWGKDTVMTPYMPDYAERDLPTRMDYYNRSE